MSTSRSPKLSSHELRLLVTFLEYCASGELDESHSFSSKIDFWTQAANFVNASNHGLERTGVEIRSKWNDWKYRVNKKAKAHQNYIENPDNGPPPAPFTDMEERISELINRVGTKSKISDSDADQQAEQILRGRLKRKMYDDDDDDDDISSLRDSNKKDRSNVHPLRSVESPPLSRQASLSPEPVKKKTLKVLKLKRLNGFKTDEEFLKTQKEMADTLKNIEKNQKELLKTGTETNNLLDNILSANVQMNNNICKLNYGINALVKVLAANGNIDIDESDE